MSEMGSETPIPSSSAAKLLSSSSASSTEVAINKLAGRALMRLEEKLMGREDGSVLSTSGQVNMLIQQATDPQLLCQLFAGWQPYL